ncbi:hypothetical protein BN2497_381 [Janthinobacterium sp. CG23_2]|nr:hypothetical protein BN2497_381 [Janthinobacterium sp. CG23_2]CUU26588.1 hypothetical protein BN3177_381 [Janthinobacterium sp. CG23_2]
MELTLAAYAPFANASQAYADVRLRPAKRQCLFGRLVNTPAQLFS